LNAARRQPAAAKRTRYHHGDVARELINASLAILSKVGAEGLSLREAARRIGVNHRAVYRHYEDKRALLAAIAEGGYRELGSDMRAAIVAVREAGADRRATFLAIAEAYLRFAQREPARFQVMFGPRLNIDERFPSLEESIRVAVDVLRTELRSIGPQAPSRIRRDLGITLWSSIHGMTSLVLGGRIPLRDTQLKTYVANIIGPVVDTILTVLSTTSP
jgi:AcrR family transcriptional regulator